MPWFNVDDGFHSHPKVLAAGNAAMGLWTRLGSYCARYATNGVVPATVVRAYGTATERKRLLEVGWLTPHPDGYELHDYLDYNRTAAQIAADRERAADRQRRKRERDEGRSHAVTEPVTDAVSHTRQSNPIQSNPITESSITGHHQSHGADDDEMTRAIERIAVALVDWRTRTDPPRDRGAYHRAALPNVIEQHGERIRELIALFPLAPVDCIVHAIETGETRGLAMFAAEPPEPPSNVVGLPERKLNGEERKAAMREAGAPARLTGKEQDAPL